MKNIFKPLNEQIQVVRIKNVKLNESERKQISKDIVFNNNIKDLNEALKLCK